LGSYVPEETSTSSVVHRRLSCAFSTTTLVTVVVHQDP
jgi:hypothetical protein